MKIITMIGKIERRFIKIRSFIRMVHFLKMVCIINRIFAKNNLKTREFEKE